MASSLLDTLSPCRYACYPPQILLQYGFLCRFDTVRQALNTRKGRVPRVLVTSPPARNRYQETLIAPSTVAGRDDIGSLYVLRTYSGCALQRKTKLYSSSPGSVISSVTFGGAPVSSTSKAAAMSSPTRWLRVSESPGRYTRAYSPLDVV